MLLTRVTNVTKNWANVNMFSVIVSLFSDIFVLLKDAAADLLCEYNKLGAAGSSIIDPVALYLTAQPQPDCPPVDSIDRAGRVPYPR